jgi:mRNA interferase HigB
MILVNAPALERAGRKNAPPRKALAQWQEKAELATWENIHDVRRMFPSADGVSVKSRGVLTVATVFNFKGNEYRLITKINYRLAIVAIMEVLTHAEYSKGAWKERL